MTKIILKRKRLHWWVIAAGHVLEAKKFGIPRRDLQTHNYLSEKPRLSFTMITLWQIFKGLLVGCSHSSSFAIYRGVKTSQLTNS